jgi:hypothetical protein
MGPVSFYRPVLKMGKGRYVRGVETGRQESKFLIAKDTLEVAGMPPGTI